MEETHEIRLKRLRIRCWHRGTKEMDLILGRYADGPMQSIEANELDALEALMAESDTDLYLWITGASPFPAEHTESINRLRDFHEIG